MPTDLTEVSQFTANVPTPDDGEDVDAASVIQFAQPLADRTQFLRAGLLEYAWVGRRVVYAPGDGTVRVGPCGGVVLGGKVLTLGSETNLGSGGRASNTVFYVYAYDNAGTLTMVEDTVAPVASLAFKSGFITHRYVGYFITDGAGVPIPMRYVDGHTVYRRSAVLGSPDKLGVLGTPTGTPWNTLSTWTDIPCSALVPAHARVARLRGRSSNSSGVTTIEVRTKGDTTAAWSVAYVGAGQTVDWTVALELNSSRVGEARMVDASSSSGQGTSIWLAEVEE